jgi:hypothetical protein
LARDVGVGEVAKPVTEAELVEVLEGEPGVGRSGTEVLQADSADGGEDG